MTYILRFRIPKKKKRKWEEAEGFRLFVSQNQGVSNDLAVVAVVAVVSPPSPTVAINDQIRATHAF